MINKRIKDKKMVMVLFLLCFMAYFSSYIGRLNFSAIMPELISKNIINSISAGSINMTFFLSYGIGQFINGIMGDRFKPRYMIFSGLMLASASNFFIPFSNSTLLIQLFWGINGYANSMIWSPILRIFSESLYPKDIKKCCVNITASMALGTLCSYFLSGLMVSIFGWKGAFIAPSVCIALFAFIFFIGMRRVEVYIEKEGEMDVMDTNAVKENALKMPFNKLLFQTGLLMFLLPVVLHGFLKDGATSWIPNYIHNEFHISTSFSSMLTMIIPIINLFGAYAAGFVNNKLKNEVYTSSFFFLLSFFALLLLIVFKDKNVIISTLLLGIVTSSMMAINTMLINFIPIHFSKCGRTSTVSGFLNASAYIGAAVCSFAVGVAINYTSFQIVFLSWALISLVGFIWCFAIKKQTFKLLHVGLSS
jgi:sugar phosphate permease